MDAFYRTQLETLLANQERTLENHLSYSIEKQAPHKEAIEALKIQIAELKAKLEMPHNSGLVVLKAPKQEIKKETFCVGDSTPVMRSASQVGSKIPQDLSRREQRAELKRLGFTESMVDQVTILMRMGRTFEQAKEETLAGA